MKEEQLLKKSSDGESFTYSLIVKELFFYLLVSSIGGKPSN